MGLSSITGGVKPISVRERKARIKKAQALMQNHGIDALVMEGGTSLSYFTGIRWGRSERYMGVVIPAQGEIAIVTPHFEEPRARERMTFGEDVRAWHEHENPFELIADIIKDRGLKNKKVAVEDRVRYFISDGLKDALPEADLLSGRDIVRGCRMYKSAHEIGLMQAASDVTMAAYAYTYNRLEAGMTPRDISSIMTKAQQELGARSLFTMALLSESSAFPHGTDKPQILEEGTLVLMDCGANVEGYQSDISRTFVFGKANARQREVWDLVKEGQDLAFKTAQIGTPCGEVDDAVRRLYEKNGFGPGYETPGLPHRTGHGIGMDGHEPVNFVHGEKTPLQKGMCLSNEPGIYIYGEFGVRLEDCLYMTNTGPKWFSKTSPSINDPFG
jgi:Xaa-Pro dipeptidase